MRVLFVSPSFYPAFHYGGPIFINRSFCEALAKHEKVQVEVLTTDANGPGKRIDLRSVGANKKDSYRIRYCRRIFPPDIAPGLLLRLFGTIRRADVVYLNGVYSFTTIPTLILCRLFRKPLAWSTMGALQRWQGTTHKRLKATWERICDVLCKSELVLLHVTSEEERIESLEKISNASAMILRNGIDIPKLDSVGKNDHRDRLRLLFIGRLDPIKGIENLLQALPLVKANVRLDICGAGDPAYEESLKALCTRLCLNTIVHFHGRVDGETKERHFQAADLCIVPSFKESFCTVLLESMARAVPVIASRGVPWQRIEEMGCGFWVENGPKSLATTIDRAAAMPLAVMGRRGRAWMQSEFSWKHVADEMVAEYERRLHAEKGTNLKAVTSTGTA